jgi:pyruvate dehydrogenase E1 component alpha subunit
VGDGALNQGVVHESLNLAALYKLPAIIIVEDNGVSIGTIVERHCADPDLINHGRRYGLPSRRINGNDVDEVVAAVGEAANFARAGRGPFFLVAQTFRLRGFSVTDPMKYRTRAQEAEGQRHEPISNYARRLIERGMIDEDGVERLENELASVVSDAIDFADDAVDPAAETRFDHVLAGRYPADGRDDQAPT